MTTILGLSAFYHDSAAALVVDGEVVAAAQEERFSRKKHDWRFPTHAIEYCLREAGLGPGDLDYVGFYDKPLLKFDRLLETYLAYAPAGFGSFLEAIPLWLRQKLHLPREMNRGLGGAYTKRYVFTHHHESHAASAFFPSPFEAAAILTLDGVGEWSTTTLGVGRGNRVELTHELRFPHSIGLLYSAFTYWTGFKVNSDEYKLMGLAPYGEPLYVDRILDKLIDLQDDGSFRMDMSYFNYCQGLTMTSAKFDALFGAPPRALEGPIRKLDMDVAASIQKVTEEIMLRCARHLHERTGMRHLCLAGGVALNCVANGRLLREGPFDDVWIQPAAGDAGGALGAALFIWHQLLDNPRRPEPRDTMRGALLGPRFADDEIGAFLDGVGARYRRVDDDGVLCDQVAAAMADGKVIGWFQGRMEFGPRALGSRSIVGDARHPEMQTVMNVAVKFRESFRPFAPAVLQDRVHDWFATRPEQESPYMLLVAQVADSRLVPPPPDAGPAQGLEKLKMLRSTIPAVTHVDDSARIQTVDAERHGLYHRLIEAFHRRTGCPVIVNTSFNLGWEPIVCSPRDAYETFMSCDMDLLCMGHFVLEKTAQPAWVGAGPDAATALDVLLASPCCSAPLEAAADGRRTCAACGAGFATEAGILQLGGGAGGRGGAGRALPESLRGLIDAARRDPLVHAVDGAIPYNADVVEVGCGNGLVSNFLGISCRRVVGVDADPEALRHAEAFRARHDLRRVRFVQAGAPKLGLRAASFDVALVNLGATVGGAGLAAVAAAVRPGGHVVVRFHPPSRGGRAAGTAAHGLDAVLQELEAAGLEFVRGLPGLVPGALEPRRGELFQPGPRGSGFDRSLAQLGWRLSGARGACLIVARRPAGAAAAPAAAPAAAQRLAGTRGG